MASRPISQAQAFWNRTKGARYSDERTESELRSELGVVEEGLEFIFPDGSSIRNEAAPLGRKLVVREVEGEPGGSPRKNKASA